MAARGSVGTGYIDVVPRLGSDWGRELTRRMQEGAGGAGDQAGRESGERFFSGFLARFRAGPFQALGGTIGRTIAAGAAAAGGIGIGKLLVDSVTNASDLNETISKVGVVFGSAAQQVLDFGRNAATALGQSRQQALEAAGTMGNLFVSMGLGAKQAADMSTSMVRLATDFASFNNASPEEALDAIKAALIGENDPIQRFGVNLNAASVQAEALRLGLAKTKHEITPAAQAQAAYSLILQQSKTAQGDFGRTSGGLANQQRILKAELLDLSAKVGAVFLPMVTRVVSGLGGMVGAIPKIAGEIGGRLKPAFDTARLGLSTFVAAFRDGNVTSGGFVGQMERIGSAARDFVPKLGDAAKSIADRLMPTLRDVGNFIAGSLWPTLKNIGSIFARLWEDIKPVVELVGGALLEALSDVGRILKDVVGPALSGLTGFIRDNQTKITALAVAVAAGAVAWYGYQAAVVAASWATYLWTSRTVIMGATMRLMPAAMAAVRGAVLALNAAFWANPIGIVIAALIALAAGFVYLWKHSESFRNFWKGLWNAIKDAASAVVDWLKNAWQTIKDAFSTAIDWIKGFVARWWPYILGIMTGGIGLAVGMVIRHWDDIKKAFSNALNWIKDKIVKPAMDDIRHGIDVVMGFITGTFKTAVRGFGVIWDGLRRAAGTPVNFVIGTVYNDGIRKAFNFVAGLIGVDKLKEAPLVKLRRGGRLPGYGGGDILPALLEPGETVVDKDRSRTLAPIFAAAGVPGYSLGGFIRGAWDATGGRVVSGVADLAGKAVEFLRGALGAGLDAALGPVRALIRSTLGTGDGWRGWLGKLALKPLARLVEWVRGRDEATLGGWIGGRAGVQRWAGVATAVLRDLGQSLSWLPALLRRMGRESGGNPRAINLSDINARHGDPSRGLMQTIGATFNAYAGPYRSRGIYDPYANIYAATRYTLARYGTLDAWNRPGGYDEGGWLHPGWTLALNKTGVPELVVPMDRLRKGGGVHYHVHMHGTVVIGGNRESAARALRDMLKDSLRGDGRHETASML